MHVSEKNLYRAYMYSDRFYCYLSNGEIKYEDTTKKLSEKMFQALANKYVKLRDE